MRQMRVVVESESTPSIGSVESVQAESGVILQRVLEGVESVVVARGTVGDIPRGFGVVQASRVDDSVGQGILSLIDVRVAGEDQVDAVFDI